MTDIRISNALTALGVDEFVLRGEPQNQDEFEAMFTKVTGADSNGSAIESSNPSDFGTTWADVKAKYDEMVAAKPMADLRVERDRRLAETDWWASSDLTMSDAQKKYRTDLRNVPAQSGVTGLDDVTWPSKPE
jgi:glycine betaine/choline ABC-type transport system substrate-binding protein